MTAAYRPTKADCLGDAYRELTYRLCASLEAFANALRIEQRAIVHEDTPETHRVVRRQQAAMKATVRGMGGQ